MEPKTRLIGNAAYIGFFGAAGVALTLYFAVTTQNPWIRLAGVAASAYFAVVLVLAGMVFAHALRRAEEGFTLETRFRRKITLATIASMTALSAALFVGAVALNAVVAVVAIIAAITTLLAIALILGIRVYRRTFPPRRNT